MIRLVQPSETGPSFTETVCREGIALHTGRPRLGVCGHFSASLVLVLPPPGAPIEEDSLDICADCTAKVLREAFDLANCPF